ncbi:MAG: hypothetical protein NC935_01490 [Candidatus Omnitrophica bacterium]|nr:hypothetical protein [Candidatus Omnitrophota bacterium]
MVRFFYFSKKLLYILLFFICLFLSDDPVFAANTEIQRPPGGAGEPWHLAMTDPEVYQIKLYKAYLVKDDGTEHTLYENSSGIIINLVNGQFTPVADVNIPPGRYTQIKIITSRTYGLKGYCYFSDNNPGGQTGYWYTKDSTDQSDIGFSSSIPTSAADYGIQRATLDDPGSGTEIGPEYEGNTTFIYTSNINLEIDYGEKPTIRAEFLADQYLELNDSTPNNGGDGGSPAEITFGAPIMEVSTH